MSKAAKKTPKPKRMVATITFDVRDYGEPVTKKQIELDIINTLGGMSNYLKNVKLRRGSIDSQ